MIIYNYELKARDFHNARNKGAPANESVVAKKARIDKCNRDWQHLKVERRKIAAHFKLQTQLTQYRESCKQRTALELLAEKHHPTKNLAKNLAAVGEIQPTPFHEPHHIIPGKGKYAQAQIEVCRLNLHMFGYGINDPLNGVWLRNFEPNRPDDWATPLAPSHRPLHNKEYERWISGQFRNDNLPEEIFFNRLRTTKSKLKTGNLPDHIFVSNAGGKGNKA